MALTYAECYPQHVRTLVLISVTMTQRSDVLWLHHENGRYLPEK
ncbi:hypothetical protein E3O47_09815 [Cryobacterium sp. TMT2-17-1]|nr:hypothetical protein E3O47_09815 [Cryobacterium sp. TMT2-17-1]